MHTKVATLSADEGIGAALAMFEDQGISGAPVLDGNGRLVGVLSLSDIARTEHLSDDPARADRYSIEMVELEDDEVEEVYLEEEMTPEPRSRERVGDWMTPEVISVGPAASLEEICRTMIDRRIHRVFVTDGPKLLGVISSFDVVHFVAHEKPRAASKAGVRVRSRVRASTAHHARKTAR
jgi:CBS domain-containing protein